MNPIYSGAHRQMVSAARGQPANWAQGPMGSIPDPMQPSLSAQRSFNNGPDPMQPALAAQQAFTTGPEQQAKFGSQIGSVIPGLGPSITLPGQQQGNPFMQWGNPGKFGLGAQMPSDRPAFSAPGMSNVFPGGRPPFGNYQPQFNNAAFSVGANTLPGGAGRTY